VNANKNARPKARIDACVRRSSSSLERQPPEMFELLCLRLFAAFGCGALLLLHRLTRLFGTLGAEFGALLALLVHHLLAAENFDERLGAAVSLAEAGEDDARIAAVAVAKARADRVEQLVNRLGRHQERRSQAAVCNPALFAERDHLLDVGFHEFGLGD